MGHIELKIASWLHQDTCSLIGSARAGLAHRAHGRRTCSFFGALLSVVRVFYRLAPAFATVGGVSTDALAEDTDLTMALCRSPWRVFYAPDAIAWTEAASWRSSRCPAGRCEALRVGVLTRYSNR